jgi:hypothetical protein
MHMRPENLPRPTRRWNPRTWGFFEYCTFLLFPWRFQKHNGSIVVKIGDQTDPPSVELLLLKLRDESCLRRAHVTGKVTSYPLSHYSDICWGKNKRQPHRSGDVMAAGVKTRKVCLARAVSISYSSFCKGNKIVEVSDEITYSENVERAQGGSSIHFLKWRKAFVLAHNQLCCTKGASFSRLLFNDADRPCGLVVIVPDYRTELYCASCEVRTEFSRRK